LHHLCAAEGVKQGGVYQWAGTYTKRKNGTFHFKGKRVERMPLQDNPWFFEDLMDFLPTNGAAHGQTG
jgi:hypothetical protein